MILCKALSYIHLNLCFLLIFDFLLHIISLIIYVVIVMNLKIAIIILTPNKPLNVGYQLNEDAFKLTYFKSN